MHRAMISFSGPKDEVVRAVDAVTAGGGVPVGPDRPHQCAWSTEAGTAAIENLSREHPNVSWGAEGFYDFEDALLVTVTTAGDTVILAEQTILPAYWGDWGADDGEPLDADILRRAADRIASAPRLIDSSFFCPLETERAAACAIGRFAETTHDRLAIGRPTPAELDAVASLGQFALYVSTASCSRTPAEREYLHAQRLTRAVLHAGRSAIEEQPGGASWGDWFGMLLSGGADIVDSAWHLEITPERDEDDHCPRCPASPEETLEASGQSLLTTCVQTLALFGSVPV